MHEKNGCLKWKLILLGLGMLFFVLRLIYIFAEPYVPGIVDYDSPPEIPSSTASSFVSLTQTIIPTEDRLNSVQLLFTDIPAVGDDSDAALALTVEKDDGTRLFTGRLLYRKLPADAWYPVFLNLPVEAGQPCRLTLTVEDPEAEAPRVCLATTTEGEPCTIDGALQAGALCLRCGYPTPVSMARRLRSAGLCAACFLLLLLLLFFWERLWAFVLRILAWLSARLPRRAVPVLLAVMELALWVLVLNKPGLDFARSTLLVLAVLSVSSFRDFEKKLAFAKDHLCHFPALFFFLLLSVYGALALVGNRRLLYPVDLCVRPKAVVAFALTAVWIAPIILSLLYRGFYFHQKATKHMPAFPFAVLCSFCLLAPALLALYAFNPGIIGSDTVGHLNIINTSITGSNDWSPPFYHLLLKGISLIWNSTYAFIFAQCLFWLYVMLDLLFFLRGRGMSDAFLLGFSVFMGCSPANFLHLCTIWKDVPHGIACLWLTVLAAKLALTGGRYLKSASFYVSLVVALVFTCLLRQNGIVPYLMFLVAGAILLYRDRRVLLSLFLSAVCVFLITGPLYRHLDIQHTVTGGKYIGLRMDMLSVYYAGGECTQEAIEIVMPQAANDLVNYAYSPYRQKTNDPAYYADPGILPFIACYIDTAAKNPIYTARSILLRQDTMLSFFDGKDTAPQCVNFTPLYTGNLNILGNYPLHKDTPVSLPFRDTLFKLDRYQLFHAVFWRSGLYSFLVLAGLFLLYLKKSRWYMILPFVPVIGIMLSLVLSSAWNDFRYYWSINITVPFLVIFILTLQADTRTS